jgi:hypothetical protein
MTKRGRPPKLGVKSAEYLFRSLIASTVFDRERSDGEKYEAAIESAVAKVKEIMPGTPISSTELKRILAARRNELGKVLLARSERSANAQQIEVVRAGLKLLQETFKDQFPKLGKSSPFSAPTVFSFGYASKLVHTRSNSVKR